MRYMVDSSVSAPPSFISSGNSTHEQYPTKPPRSTDFIKICRLGVVILKDVEPVSGASSYSEYRGGIEIEIDTREDYRRKVGISF